MSPLSVTAERERLSTITGGILEKSFYSKTQEIEDSPLDEKELEKIKLAQMYHTIDHLYTHNKELLESSEINSKAIFELKRMNRILNYSVLLLLGAVFLPYIMKLIGMLL